MSKPLTWPRLVLAGLTILTTSGICAAKNADSDTGSSLILKFGVVPQHTPLELASTWIPVTEMLSQALKRKVVFETAPSIQEFEKRLASGAYAFAYVNPFHYVVFHSKPGYEVLAMESDKKLEGIVVAKAGSSISKVEQLKGKKVAFPSPNAFAASVLIQKALNDQLKLEVEPVYVNSHDSVFQNVAAGLFVAGGGVEKTFSELPSETKNQLQVIYRTAKFNPHPIIYLNSLPPQLVQDALKVFLDMAKDPRGKTVLATLKSKGWKTAADKDYDEVRALGAEFK
jgi:phosphonate transport system substrate-binding protein